MSDSIEKQNLKRAIKEAFNTQPATSQQNNLSTEDLSRQALENISNKIDVACFCELPGELQTFGAEIILE